MYNLLYMRYGPFTLTNPPAALQGLQVGRVRQRLGEGNSEIKSPCCLAGQAFGWAKARRDNSEMKHAPGVRKRQT